MSNSDSKPCQEDCGNLSVVSLTLPSRCILAANGVPEVFLVNQEKEAFPSRAHINLEALMFLAFQNEPKRPIPKILSSCNLG